MQLKYFIHPLGCAMNTSDAERLAAVLEGMGCKEADDDASAQIVAAVACSVRQSAIDRIYGKIEKWKERQAKGENLVTMLSGCVLPADKKKFQKLFDIVFDIKELPQLKEKLSGFFAFDKNLEQAFLEENGKNAGSLDDYFSITPKYSNLYQSYIPISTGCNNFCTYCAVPYTRGREISRPMEDVLLEAERCVKNGSRVITLLGQNVNSYGLDWERKRKYESGAKNHFVELLRRVDTIDGDFWVFFTSNHPKDVDDELLGVFANGKKLCKLLHLPIQAGDDEVLKRMNRNYTREEYLNLVEKVYKKMPDIALTTDIIVGFPGETEEQFQKTKEVCEKAKYDMAFIAKYSPRPGSYAAEKFQDDVSKEEKERRWKEVTEIVARTAFEKNKELAGREMRVFIESFERGRWIGRTEGYKKVIFSEELNEQLKEGEFVIAKIMKAYAWALEGVIGHG